MSDWPIGDFGGLAATALIGNKTISSVLYGIYSNEQGSSIPAQSLTSDHPRLYPSTTALPVVRYAGRR